MFWREPQICQIVRQYLATGNTRTAAEVLLAQNVKNHRTVQVLTGQVIRQLISSVEQQIAQPTSASGSLSGCDTLLQLARNLGAPSVQVADLEQQLHHRNKANKAKRNWKADRYRKVRQLAQQGRFVSAVQYLPVPSEHVSAVIEDNSPFLTESNFLRHDLNYEISQLDRRLQEADHHLEAGHLSAAQECWERAATVARLDPRVVKLGTALKNAGQEIQTCPPSNGFELPGGDCIIQAPQATTIKHSSSVNDSQHLPAIRLNNSDLQRPISLESKSQRWLVMMSESFMLGGCDTKDPSSVAEGELRLDVRLLPRELAVVRDGNVVKLATPWKTRGCAINGKDLQNDQVQALLHGDEIELQNGRLKLSVHQPNNVGSTELRVDPRTPIRCSDGFPVHGIILFHETLVIGDTNDATCRISGGGTVTLHRNDLTLTATSADRVVWWEAQPDARWCRQTCHWPAACGTDPHRCRRFDGSVFRLSRR